MASIVGPLQTGSLHVEQADVELGKLQLQPPESHAEGVFHHSSFQQLLYLSMFYTGFYCKF